MNLSEQIAQMPELTSALARWAAPDSFTDAPTLRQAILRLNLPIPPDFLTPKMVGMVARLAGVRVVRTRAGARYIGIRPPAADANAQIANG